MRWWVSLALVAGCHAAAPRVAPAPAAGCKVTAPACDPAVADADALAVVERRCAGCHAEGGRGGHTLTAPAALQAARGEVALRLAGCEMPPEGPPLPAGERARLLGWAACAPGESAHSGEPNAGSFVYAGR